MGLLALALPSLLCGNIVRERPPQYDPEKAKDPSPVVNSQIEGDLDSEHASSDILINNTPYHRIRHVYPHTFSEPIHLNTFCDDLPAPIPSPSLYSRFRSYLWPTNDDIIDLDPFVPNYRWTPIVSGIVIPFSILLEIPGLTERWYIRTENNKTVETQPNPIILDIGLAFSITCALVANIALILRFLEKRVQTVTLLCIVFLTIHDIINIIAVTVFGVEHRFDDGFTYGEAFWMTLCSTIASTVTNVSLIVDFARTPDFAKRGSGLTRKQRALMIIVIVLLIYIALGALIHSILLHLSFIDGLYFTVVSIETIGFGDIAPHTTAGRVWTCLYISVGVLHIGVAIAMCRETILEGLEIGYRRRMQAMRERRREARRLRRWETRWHHAVEFRLREANLPLWVPNIAECDDGVDGRRSGLASYIKAKFPFLSGGFATTLKRSATMTSIESVFSIGGGGSSGSHRGRHLNVEALTRGQLEEAALEAGVPLDMFLDRADAGRSCRLDAPPGMANASGWPQHARALTPTHAQVSRMAAILTKFAVAVSGVPIEAPRQGNESNHIGKVMNDGGGRPDDDAGESKIISSSDSGFGRVLTNNGKHGVCGMDMRAFTAAGWAKDEFPYGHEEQTRPGWTYATFKVNMEVEERKASYVKLTIAWLLFFVFWTAGSGIFCVTEGWSYGTAMYFCFVAFSTTGYGDFSPQTPAGRSIFVVWALFGVGTVTILASVLQEAGSSRYKDALHSRVFDKAVNRYRKRQRQERKQQHSDHAQQATTGRDGHDAISRANTHGQDCGDSSREAESDATTAGSGVKRLQDSEEVARRELEALPSEVVRSVRTFHEYVQFFIADSTQGMNTFEDDRKPPTGLAQQQHGQKGLGMRVPPDMKKLLDELGEMESINDSLKVEILQDEDARKTLFMLSIERSLKHLVASAESALAAQAERDALASIMTPDGQRWQDRREPSPSSKNALRLHLQEKGEGSWHVGNHQMRPLDHHVRHASISPDRALPRGPSLSRSSRQPHALGPSHHG